MATNHSNWISCKKEQPKEYGLYLAVVSFFVPDMGFKNNRYYSVRTVMYRPNSVGWDLGDWNEYRIKSRRDRVLLWMPIPELPTGYQNRNKCRVKA